MMKKVLIISYLFAPDNKIGSVRPTKIAKYFALNDICVDVVTKNHAEDQNNGLNTHDLVNINRIIEIDHSAYFKCKVRSSNNIKYGIKQKLLADKESKLHKMLGILFRWIMDLYQSYDFYKQFKIYYKNNLKRFKGYDVVISTFGPAASLFCGYYLKKYQRDITWVCDFRDPMVVEFSPCYSRLILSIIQKKACIAADYVTAVSRGYLHRICRNNFKNKAFFIPNGYDNDDYYMSANNISENRFSFTYAGYLYEGKRDISPLFAVFKELIDEGYMYKGDVVFEYAGDEFNILVKQAKKYNMNDILFNHGFLNRDACLQLQFSSRFLVLSTWNNKGEEGVFPGKFLEYMLIKKPIISIVVGNLPNSEVTEVMDAANLGVSYESVRHDTDYSALREYIKKEYLRFKEGLGPDFSPKTEVIEHYNYKNIAKQFEELFDIC